MIPFISTVSKALGCNNIEFDSDQAKALVTKVFDNARKADRHIGLDFETQGLDPIIDKPLILGISTHSTNDDFVCIECWKRNPVELFPDDWEDFCYVAHNAKYDVSLMHYTFDTLIKNVFCTMVGSQKLSQNLPIAHNLGAVCFRYTGIELPKGYAKSFIGKNPDRNPMYTFEQINYLKEDVIHLVAIKNAMIVYSDKYKLTRWLYGVEFRLIPILAVSENTGVRLDIESMRKIEADNKALIHKTAVELDNELQRLADTLPPTQRRLLKGGKFTKQRNNYHPGSNQITIFGDVIKDKVVSHGGKKNAYKDVKSNTSNVNWNSDLSLIDVFARLGEPLMTKNGDYLIPYLDNKGKVFRDRAYTVLKGERTNVRIEGFQTNKKAFAQYFIDYPKAKVKDLVQLYLKYNKLCHETSTFATGLINKVYDETKRLHTMYKQASTANARFSSGSDKGRGVKKRFQSQNIPRDKKFRNCILAPYPNWRVSTCDLSGAEVTILCDKANDRKLYEWAVKNDDAHSPIVQNSWRHIFLYRAGYQCGEWLNASDFMYKFKYGTIEEVAKRFTKVKNKKANYYAKLALEFEVSRIVNAAYRQGGKNNTFGSIYNMGPKTAADTYNGTTAELLKRDPNAKPVSVTVDEAKVAVYAIKNEIPVAFKFVEGQAIDAICNGYLVLNDRSNSRVWFNEVLKILEAVNITVKENARQYGTVSKLDTVDYKNGVYTMNTGEEFKMEWKFLVDIDGQARNLPISGTQADMIKESMVVTQRYIDEQNYPAIFMLQVHDETVYGYDPKAGNINYRLNGENKTACFNKFHKDIMADTATKYLKNFEMKAEVEDHLFWTK